ncbi:TIGR02556 family CRISPR-associated protein [candidate division KSB1 bacterium]|nr:TIGR02556 family CRISPR-associated protein [candidate division KSB1 bacterium]
MIHSIMKLGQYRRAKADVTDPLERYLENPFRDNKGYVFGIVLEKQNDQWQYQEIHAEEFNKTKFAKLLFRSGSPRGPNFSPSAVVTEIHKTFEVKVLGWFKSNLSNSKKLEKQVGDTTLLTEIYQTIRADQQKIAADLEAKSAEISDQKASLILTIVLNSNGEKKYLGDIDIFRNLVEKQTTESYRFVKTFGESYSHDQQCAVCGLRKQEVNGFFTHFSFYTLDKPGFISGGFNYDDAWKNYPVCTSCCSLVEEGSKLLDENLTFQFYGFRYYLIPTFYNSHSDEIIDEMLDWVKEPKFQRKVEQRITNSEKEILELVAEKGDVLSLRFLFFERIQSAFRILMVLEDILPSRLNRLFELKNQLQKMDIFTWSDKEGHHPIYFNFGILREFFPNKEDYGNHDRHFLELSGRIISGRTIDYYFLMKGIMTRLRFLFSHDINIGIQTRSAFMLLNFINELHLFHNFRGKEYAMNEELIRDFKIQSREEFPEKVESFFSTFPAFFTNSAEKAIFLTGVLARFLLNIQNQEKKSTPFRSKLKGLKMSGEQINQLLPQIQEKLEQYDKNYYQPLENSISEYFLKAGKPHTWKLHRDEMNFIFTLGMNLSHYFKIQKQEGDNNE